MNDLNPSDETISNTPLEQADQHIQLAVDLIYLLESNDLPAETVVKALNIVTADFKQKLNPPS